VIPGAIESADLGGNIRLESAIAENQKNQGWEKQAVKSHKEVTDGHEDCPEHDCPALPQNPVCKQSSEKRREINKARIKPVYVRSLLLAEKKVLHHIVDKERFHPVIGETLPHFCEKKKVESLGM